MTQISEKDSLALSPSGIYFCRLSDTVQLDFASASLCSILGCTSEELKYKFHNDYSFFIHPDDLPSYQQLICSLASRPGIQTEEYRIVRPDGTSLYVTETIESSLQKDGTMLGYSSVTDLSSIKEHEKCLARQNHQFKAWYQELKSKNERLKIVSSYCGVLFYEYNISSRRYVHMENVRGVLGFGDQELLEQMNSILDEQEAKLFPTLFPFVHPEDYSIMAHSVETLKHEKESHCNIRIRTSSGDYIWCSLNHCLITDDNVHPDYVLGSVFNIDDTYRKMEHLIHQAAHDSLTQLFTRESAFTLINALLKDRPHHSHALILLHLHPLEQTAVRFEYPAKNRILIDITQILHHFFRQDDIISRSEDNDFFIFLPSITSESAVVQKAERLLGIIKKDILSPQENIPLRIYVNTAFANGSSSAEALFHHALTSRWHNS